MSDTGRSFQAADIEKKYRKLVWSGLLFVFLGAGIMISTFMYFNNKGAYEHDAPQALFPLLPFFLFFIPAYGYGIFKRGFQDWKLFKRSEVKGLRINDEGITGSILLLEGVFSELHLQKKLSDFSFTWDKINNFIVEPPRGSNSYGSPRYYKITFDGQKESADSSCFIMRECFKADDAQIIGMVRKNLGEDRVVLNDEIFGEIKEAESEE